MHLGKILFLVSRATRDSILAIRLVYIGHQCTDVASCHFRPRLARSLFQQIQVFLDWFVEATIVRVVGGLRPIVPLPECPSSIARFLEYIGDRGLVQIQALFSGRDAANAGFRMVSSCQKLSSGRRTHLTHVEILERQPLIAEAIDIGSGEILVSVEAEITPALVVRKNYHDIWRAS